MSGPHGSWHDKHYVYRPTWGSGGAYGDGYDEQHDEQHGDTYGHDSYGDDTYVADAYGDASYDDHAQAGDGAAAGYWGPYEHDRAGVGDSVRGAFGGLAWRYRSAPLWVRATIDVSAAVLVLALLIGGSLALRGQAGPEGAEVSADGTTSTSADGAGGPLPTGSDALAPSSSTSTTPTTRPASSAPTTATTRAPTTVTTATTVPPTTTRRPPGPPSTGSTTTTTPAEVHYRNCLDAWRAGALPLFAGDPGYSRRLDDDGDGQACEPGEF